MARPILKIFKIKLSISEDDQKTISLCMNKLKVMTIKTLYKESTSLEYLIDCYTSQLKASLNEHSLRYRDEEKNEKYRLLDILFSRHSFIYHGIQSLAKRFDVISPMQIRTCKIAPHKYFKALRQRLVNERPILYVNFFTESLLYIDHEYLKFDTNMLFCPVVFRGNTVTLS